MVKRIALKLLFRHTIEILVFVPSPELRIFTCYADRFEPECGLEPRFESLPQFGKYPNSPGGVIAKAITPQPQLVNILSSSDLFFVAMVNKSALNVSFECVPRIITDYI